MLSTLALFGHPFDCTHDHYWIEPSKSFKRDKTSKLTIDKTKVLSPDSLKRLFLLTLKTLHPAIKIFETELKQALEIASIDLDHFFKVWCMEKENQAQLVEAKKSPKLFQRYVNFHLDQYHEEFYTYLETANPRIMQTWIFTGLSAFCTKHSARLFPDINRGDPVDFYDLAKRILPENQLSSFMKLIDHLMAREDYVAFVSVYANALLCVFDCLNNNNDVKQAVIIAWQIAYNTFMDEIFGLVLYHFRDLVNNRSLFPYLNPSMFDFFFKYLDAQTEHGISMYDYHMVFETFSQSILPKAIELEPYQAFTDISNFIHRANVDTHAIAVNQLHSLIDNFESVVAGLNSKKIQLTRPFTSSNVSAPDLSALSQKLSFLVYHPVKQLAEEYGLSSSDTAAKIKEINDLAIELAANPLDNIAKLNELSQQKLELESKLEIAANAYLKDVEKYVSSHNQIIEDHNIRHNPKDDNNQEIEVLQGLLSDASHTIDELTRDKKVLTEQLGKAQLAPKQNDKVTHHSLDRIIAILESKNPIVVIVEELVSSRPWVKISDKLIKSLYAVSGFSRPAELARQLDKLTSREFLDAIEGKGSLGAFDFFTKSALSFKESETTMSSPSLRRQREFLFAGAKILCEPHLRIGINNSEQEQLRIHFSISDGIIYLGYIGRHLPTGAM